MLKLTALGIGHGDATLRPGSPRVGVVALFEAARIR
jgi:hypothetical protein